MDVIKAKSITQAMSELHNFRSIEVVFKYLDERQPALPLFTQRYMEAYSGKIVAKTIALVWFVLRVFEIDQGESLRARSLEELQKWGDLNLHLFRKTQGMPLPKLFEIMELEQANQPVLMQMIIPFFSDMLGDPPYEPLHVEASVMSFLAVKSIVEVFDREE